MLLELFHYLCIKPEVSVQNVISDSNVFQDIETYDKIYQKIMEKLAENNVIVNNNS